MNSFKIFSRDNKKKADYNIYVIGGESDVLKHQKRVNDILLAHSNIAIYYKEKEVDLDLYNDALSTFNLTVILISFKFSSRSCGMARISMSLSSMSKSSAWESPSPFWMWRSHRLSVFR